MTERSPGAVTLNTLHDDLVSGFVGVRAEFADLRSEMRAGFAGLRTEIRGGVTDLKATLVSGFRSLPTRETSEEMVCLLREGNRLQDERLTQLDRRSREQFLETQQVLHAVVDGQRRLVEGQRAMSVDLKAMSADIKAMSVDIKALVARIDALIRGRGNGDPTA